MTDQVGSAMQRVNLDNIPKSLTELRQWVVWKMARRSPDDKEETKLPFQINGDFAEADNPETWCSWGSARSAYQYGDYRGVGFEFSVDDPFCGVDLDKCRNPKTGKVSEWAREIILKFASYAEVSPSETGVKIFCRGKSPFDRGRKKKFPELEKVCDDPKDVAIEIYDQRRYFAVTGWRLGGVPHEPTECQEHLEWLKSKYFNDDPKPVQDFRSGDAVFERARKYLEKLPAAVSGSNGHGATFHAACVLVLGFELSESEAMSLMREYNARCQPSWSERELEHKVKSAFKQPGQRGFLRNSAPDKWQGISVPDYAASLPPEPKTTTLVEATKGYIESIRNGQVPLISTSIPDLDFALSGGLERSEMVIFAARPSHGKSLAALQLVHHWTATGIPCAIVSEEMSPMMLGKRTLHFVSALHQEHWHHEICQLEHEIAQYETTHAPCPIFESCGTAQKAVECIERSVEEHGVRCAVVDYAQLLRSPGKTRYEQVTNTSIALRQLANRCKITLLVLCQLNREIEHRPTFTPTLADIKETGQLEQDADVVVGLSWPYKMNTEEPPDKYQFHILKNRNRGIREACVNCRLVADRQMILDPHPGQFGIEAAHPHQQGIQF
jgi:hypothetical protein